MEFAEGKIIMALEGGYNLVSLANSVLACVEVLLEDKPIAGSSEAYPFESTWRVIQAVSIHFSVSFTSGCPFRLLDLFTITSVLSWHYLLLVWLIH